MKKSLGGGVNLPLPNWNRVKINGYKDCLLNKEIVLKSQKIFKSERPDVYTEEINKKKKKTHMKQNINI